jgi:cytochrome c1
MRTTIVMFVALVPVALAAGCDDAERRAAAQMTGGGDPERGRHAIAAYGCSSCHTIPGVRGADGLVGPPLTGMGSRAYVGGVMKNTPQNLVRWIRDPPAVDPMTAMPKLGVSEPDARDIASYLDTLR